MMAEREIVVGGGQAGLAIGCGDDVVAYLTDYARRFELPVELNSRVVSVRARDGGFLVELADRTYETGQVVIATGPFQIPFTPAMAGGLGADVVQLHSSDYR